MAEWRWESGGKVGVIIVKALLQLFIQFVSFAAFLICQIHAEKLSTPAPQYLCICFGSLGRGGGFPWGLRPVGRREAQFHINNLPLRLRIILRYEDTTPRARNVCAFHSWRRKVCWENCKCNANYESAVKVERIVEWMVAGREMLWQDLHHYYRHYHHQIQPLINPRRMTGLL